MTHGSRHMTAAAAALASACAALAGGSTTEVWTDPVGDWMPRPTDGGADRPFDPGALPDLVELRLMGWTSPTPQYDPWSGAPAPGEGADLFRMDIVFAGVVNPPGSLNVGQGGFTPFAFGPRPLFGFIEIDVDDDKDTGGELEPLARNRFLGNVGRFGGLPEGSIGQRACRDGWDWDNNFSAGRQFERSGAELAIVCCGCFSPTIVSQNGDMDGKFEAGETFVVRGRFFERMQALRPFSGVSGGSEPGMYNPFVNLRFAHDIATDRTTVSLVYALTMEGAAMLEGGSVQPSDFDVLNHTSVQEALDDIICAASGEYGPISDPAVQTLVDGWSGESASDGLDPTDWRVTALVGGTYDTLGTSLYVWSDVGFEAARGDFTLDGSVNFIDAAEWVLQRDAMDGTSHDGDGSVNGEVEIINHAYNFSVYDYNSDGLINNADADLLLGEIVIPGDLNHDCIVNTADLGVMLSMFGGNNPEADLNGDGVVNTADLGLLVGLFGATCG